MEAYPNSPEQNWGDEDRDLPEKGEKKKKKKRDFFESLKRAFTRETDEDSRPSLLDRLLFRDGSETSSSSNEGSKEASSNRTESRLEKMRGQLLSLLGVGIENNSESAAPASNGSGERVVAGAQSQELLEDIELELHQQDQRRREQTPNFEYQIYQNSTEQSAHTNRVSSPRIEAPAQIRDRLNRPPEVSVNSSDDYTGPNYSGEQAATATQERPVTRQENSRSRAPEILLGAAYLKSRREAKKQAKQLKKVEKVAKKLERENQDLKSNKDLIRQRLARVEAATEQVNANAQKTPEKRPDSPQKPKKRIHNPYSAHARNIEHHPNPDPAIEQQAKESTKESPKAVQSESLSKTTPEENVAPTRSQIPSNEEIFEKAKRDHFEQYGGTYDPETLKKINQSQNESIESQTEAVGRSNVQQKNLELDRVVKDQLSRPKVQDAAQKLTNNKAELGLVVLVVVLFIIYLST